MIKSRKVTVVGASFESWLVKGAEALAREEMEYG